LDLEAFVRQAEALNQRNHERFTSPFPKRPSRWISHYQFEPRPITLTNQGAVEGGLSWRMFGIRVHVLQNMNANM
jgi:hypothetical protein